MRTKQWTSSKKQHYTQEHDQLVIKIILALAETELCKCWQQPTGAAYRKGQLIRYGLKGSADISGIVRGGRRLEIEVKTGQAKQHGAQPAFERMITEFGGIYFVARSVEDALNKLRIACAE